MSLKKTIAGATVLVLCLPFFQGTIHALDYTGSAYPDGIPHPVPGIIEAEDFDSGGESISYHDQDNRNEGDSNYRPGTGVDVERRNSASNGNNIGNASEGEWTKYTILVTEAGSYRIDTYCVSGVGNGKFRLEIDDKPVGRMMSAPNGEWDDFSKASPAENIQLTAGIHILTWYSHGGINVDKLTFTKTGEWKGENETGNFDYPVEKKMQNPLFVDFDSPLYDTRGFGALYTADPSAHVWNDGRLYVYASHDMEPPRAFDRMDRYHVFSTNDMENWTDHGEILNSSQVEWGCFRGGFLWAPDCAYNPANETYYFYFPHLRSGDDGDDGDIWEIGVAVSKKPAADFQVQGYIRGMEHLIDPCVFVDEDGQPYIYPGGGGRCVGGKLDKNDWTKLDGGLQEMQGLQDFHEAAWVHKRNGMYYLSFADNHGEDGNQLKYAVSNHPLGPWIDKGAYLYANGSGTDHGSIVSFRGKWYAFYHTANYSGDGTLRSVCFDSLEYNPDGTIQVVKNYGTPYGGTTPEVMETDNPAETALMLEAENFNDGGEHAAYHDKEVENKGNNTLHRPGERVDIFHANGLDYVGRFIKGEWMRYTFRVKKAGRYDIDCFVSNSQNNSRFHLSINGSNRSGPMQAGSAGTNFQPVTATDILLSEGEQYLDVRVEEGEINIDRLVFRQSAPYRGTPYKQHAVPGTIEAEDFDSGGQGVACFDSTPDRNDGGYNYRNQSDGGGVDIENSAGNIHISHTGNGEWLKYTFVAEQEGEYAVAMPVSTGNNADGLLYLSFDDTQITPVAGLKTTGWNDYALLTVENINLTKGLHVMTLHIVGNINVDKLIFEHRTPAALAHAGSRTACLYPNPTAGLFFIHPPEVEKVKIYNLPGREIYSGDDPCVDLSGYPGGIYLVTFTAGKENHLLKLLKR
jgi:hypothetical protein